jgi:hypothetical protein
MRKPAGMPASRPRTTKWGEWLRQPARSDALRNELNTRIDCAVSWGNANRSPWGAFGLHRDVPDLAGWRDAMAQGSFD